MRGAFRHDSLSELDKEVLDFRFPHLLCNFEEDVPIHIVAANISNRVMETVNRDFLLRLDKSIKLFAFWSADIDEVLAIERINNWNSFGVGLNLAIEDIDNSMGFGGIEGVWVNSGPVWDGGKAQLCPWK